VARLLAAVASNPALELNVDVESRTVTVPALRYARSFPLDEASRSRLLAGRDEIDQSLAHERAIAAYEARRASWMPYLRPRA